MLRQISASVLSRALQLQPLRITVATPTEWKRQCFSSLSPDVVVDKVVMTTPNDVVVKAACGDLPDDDDDDEMEKEEMFVTAHESFPFRTREWGGPRRGGRLPEPTRYGDWERKGRATDF